jgi:hypothetical protein
MRIRSYGNFQVGMVDDPSVEDKGGFEFASGMDIFSEPGVLKANFALTAISGLSPTTFARWLKVTTDASSLRGYLAYGDKIYESTDGVTWSSFLTNANGTILGLDIWAGYVMYASTTKLGRCPVGNAAGKNDSWQTIDTDSEWHPMQQQGGTLKVGAGRYIVSVDESFNFTAQAMKIPIGYRVRTLANYFTKLFVGSRFADYGATVPTHDATVFDWRGTVLATGTALPDNPYPLSKRGMAALLASGQGLFAFPDREGEIYIFNGATFVPYKKLHIISNNGELVVSPPSVTEHIDSTLFTGDSAYFPGIYQMKDGAICQAFVPSAISPGATEQITFGFLASCFDGKVLVSYHKPSTSTYHIEYVGTNRQNNAVVRTLYHRAQTDRLKRWMGVKLNLKPMAANTVVTVAYRTSRDASFTSAPYTITSANQDKPVIFTAQPRSREIQLKLTYTTSTTTTPELLDYDLLYDVISSTR